MPRLQGRMPDLRRTATRRRPDLPNQDVARTILVLLLLFLAGAAIPLPGQTSPPFEVSTTTVKLTDLRVSAHVIRADLSRLQPRLGLAHGRVGQTQELADLARKAGALAAINGSYFEAYTASAIKNPNHTLFHEGRVVAKGNIGSVLGFAADGRARIEPLRLKIEGALDGSFRYPDNWHAYWVNRLPEGAPTITLFTPDWGPRTGLSDGVQVVVSGGRVTHLVAPGAGACPIPTDGFVVYFRGEREQRLAQRFRVGRACSGRLVRDDGAPLGFWSEVVEGVGAGPRLVRAGRVDLSPENEGFKDPKIITAWDAPRSMVGIDRNGRLLMVTSHGQVRQMAELMRNLGAVEAMCLDGGASSGLWTRKGYLTPPGRPISNALMIVERPNPPGSAPPWATSRPHPPPAPPPRARARPRPRESDSQGRMFLSREPEPSGVRPGTSSSRPRRTSPAQGPGTRRERSGEARGMVHLLGFLAVAVGGLSWHLLWRARREPET